MQTEISKSQMVALLEGQTFARPDSVARILRGECAFAIGDAEFIVSEKDQLPAGSMQAQAQALIERMKAGNPGSDAFADRVATLVEEMMGASVSSPPVARTNLTSSTRDMGDQVADLVEQQLGKKQMLGKKMG